MIAGVVTESSRRGRSFKVSIPHSLSDEWRGDGNWMFLRREKYWDQALKSYRSCPKDIQILSCSQCGGRALAVEASDMGQSQIPLFQDGSDSKCLWGKTLGWRRKILMELKLSPRIWKVIELEPTGPVHQVDGQVRKKKSQQITWRDLKIGKCAVAGLGEWRINEMTDVCWGIFTGQFVHRSSIHKREWGPLSSDFHHHYNKVTTYVLLISKQVTFLIL